MSNGYPEIGKFYQAKSSGRKVQVTKVSAGRFFGHILMNDGSTVIDYIGGTGYFNHHWKEIPNF